MTRAMRDTNAEEEQIEAPKVFDHNSNESVSAAELRQAAIDRGNAPTDEEVDETI